MPKQKDLKRLVRTRMDKTGESYTTARSHILKKRGRGSSPVPESEWPALAGMSDDAVRRKTGRTWKQWVGVLDAVDATTLRHRDIARYLRDDHDVDAWWSQMLTVGYERIRGLRDVGQRRGGHYDANKSKTFGVPLPKLYKAFSVARTRARWLPGVKLAVRTAQPNKSMRVTWPDGTSVHFYFTARGEAKSVVTIQHTGFKSKTAVARSKAYWGERLDALAEVLTPARRR